MDRKTSDANTVTAAFYRGKDDKVSQSTTSTLILANEYALSKRTTLYGQVAFANADAREVERLRRGAPGPHVAVPRLEGDVHDLGGLAALARHL